MMYYPTLKQTKDTYVHERLFLLVVIGSEARDVLEQALEHLWEQWNQRDRIGEI